MNYNINKIMLNNNTKQLQICLPSHFWTPESILEAPSCHFPRNYDFQETVFFRKSCFFLLLVYILMHLLLWKCSYGPWDHFMCSWKTKFWPIKISQISVFCENQAFHFVFVNGKFHHVHTDDKGFYFLDITLYFLDIDIPISHSGHIPHGQRINRSWKCLFSCMGLRGCTRINISWEFEFSYNLNQDFTISAGMWSLELWFWVVREWTFPGNVHSGAKEKFKLKLFFPGQCPV